MEHITKFKLALRNLRITTTSINNVVDTMILKFSNGYGSAIASAIEEHIFTTNGDEMLACLYLIDALIKKYGMVWHGIIQNKIVKLFSHAFEKSNNTEIRHKLFKLRCAWQNAFPKYKLHAIDMNIKEIDNAWPIMVSTPSPSSSSSSSSSSSLSSASLDQSEFYNNKIEQYNDSISEAKSRFIATYPYQHIQYNLKHHYFDRTDPRFKIQNFTSVEFGQLNSIEKKSKRPAENNTEIPRKIVKTSNDNGNNNNINSITELMDKLVSTGLIRDKITSNKNEVLKIAIEKIVALSKELFQESNLKTRDTIPIDDLHNAMQCSNCGLCFSLNQINDYGAHLDWHFQQKNTTKDDNNEMKSREWYSRSRDWLNDDA